MATPFDIGSDARLAARPASVNPYRRGSAEHSLFAMGWRDVHRFWGLCARWPVRALPALPEEKHQPADTPLEETADV